MILTINNCPHFIEIKREKYPLITPFKGNKRISKQKIQPLGLELEYKLQRHAGCMNNE